MQYYTFPNRAESLSIIGLGTGSISGPVSEIEPMFAHAFDNGINYFDFAARDINVFRAAGSALKNERNNVFFQVHFGANYENGKYGFTSDLGSVKKSIDMQLKYLSTDYIDFGYIHCIDNEEVLSKYIKNGILDYILKLKQSGIVHHIGLSSHTPSIVSKVIDMGIVDTVMFSINVAYDFQFGGYPYGSTSERYSLYKTLKKDNINLVSMKPFCGGRLLDAHYSPFMRPLSRSQCLQYVFDMADVSTIFTGCRRIDDINQVLDYFNASAQEKDYSIIQSFKRVKDTGCVYCQHCHPCPAGIDIALLHKYYDLASQGDILAFNHYYALERKADICIHCGQCNLRCPFGLDVENSVLSISNFFNNNATG